MQEQIFAYIGRVKIATQEWPANSIPCVVVDDGTHRELVAHAVMEWLRDGLAIERVPLEWARKFLFTTEVYREGETQ